jgi:hypothetical protein
MNLWKFFKMSVASCLNTRVHSSEILKKAAPLYVGGSTLLQMYQRLMATLLQNCTGCQRVMTTLLRICYRLSEGKSNPLTNFSKGTGNFCKLHMFVRGFQIPTSLFPEGIDYLLISWQRALNNLWRHLQGG